MTLTTRLLLFFLSMLALVLIGFSIALYLVADNYLHQQVVDRVNAVLNSLSAAVESDSGGLEWEPSSRRLNLNFSALGDRIEWLVEDTHGDILDRSNPVADRIRPRLNAPTEYLEDWNGSSWQVGHRCITAEQRSGDTDDEHDFSGDDHARTDSLTISAAVSLGPVHTTLRRLMGALVVLSTVIWIAGLIIGRSICRRALRPVNEMAEATRLINVGDLGQRLPRILAKDQLGELNHAFNDLLDRLQESFERQRRFTSDASHQLRTPLTTILGQVEVALRRDRPQEEYRRVLTTVQQNASHLARLVETLLFLARTDVDSSALALEPVDLAIWLPSHLQTWSAHDRFSDIHLRMPSDPSCRVTVHSQLLGELLNILLDNACKYSDPQSTIEVQLRWTARSVQIGVEDHGWGIAETDMQRLFTPFCRSEEVRRRGVEGVGLGLSIAARLAKSFGGQISAVSQIGYGSCFTIQFEREDTTR